jgi:hypothetical protein
MALCMLVITIISASFGQKLVESRATYSSLTSIIENAGASYAIIVLLCVFITFFALSWGPIGWIYPAEIYPQMIRANAMGVTTSCSYLFNLFVSLVSPIMFRDIRWGTYLFFALMCVIMAIVVHRCFPETRGRSLEEIQLIFSGALIDQRPDAHHPATAAEALLHLEQIQHKDKLDQLKYAHQQRAFDFDIPIQWSEIMEVSGPHNVTRALNHQHEHHNHDHHVPKPPPLRPEPLHHKETMRSSASIKSWVAASAQYSHHSNTSSIELSIKPSSSKRINNNGDTSKPL